MTECAQELYTTRAGIRRSALFPVARVAKRTPGWLPDATLHYLLHIEMGKPIREIARAVGCHASTISRQVRKVESLRDDPLIDAALVRIGSDHFPTSSNNLTEKEKNSMTALSRIELSDVAVEAEVAILPDEMRNALRRMAESGAVLAVAAEMEKGVIMRNVPGGEAARTAVISREIAETMALRDWITCIIQGRISRYEITAAGRSALKRDTERRKDSDGFAEVLSPYRAQHGEWDDAPRGRRGSKRARPRVNLAESPLAALARRRDKDGKLFLEAELVAAGERLREDFELAQMGPRVAQNWENFLTVGASPSSFSGDRGGSGSCAARERVSTALGELGPGLGDVVLRCCCYLEGMETVERQLGWSARSGKVVLRIALQRLQRHYEETMQGRSPMIG